MYKVIIMQINSSYPVICTSKIEETKSFYIDNFRFKVTFESDWYISFSTNTEPSLELTILDYSHTSLPENFREPTKGIVLNFEVENVDNLYKKITKKRNKTHS